MRIGVDIDGVLTDIINFQKEKGKKFLKKEVINENGFTMQELFDCSKKMETKFWTRYLIEYVTCLSSRKDSAFILNKFKNNGDKIFIITSRIYTDRNDKIGDLMRFIVKEWLKYNKIPYDKIIFCKENKIEAIKKNNINVMIDDDKKNVIDLKDVTKVIIFSEKHNEDINEDNVFRAKNWCEVGNFLDVFSTIYNKKMDANSLNQKPSIGKVWEKYYTRWQKEAILFKQTIYSCMENGVLQNKNREVLNYFGKSISGSDFLNNINELKQSLFLIFKSIGISNEEIHNEIISICSPNIPEALYTFYGANRLGVVCNMIHPLSGAESIKKNVNRCNSKVIFCIDVDYEKIKEIIDDTNIEKVVILSAKDSMPMIPKIVYTNELKKKLYYKDKIDDKYINWEKFANISKDNEEIINDFKYKENYPAVILNTGGTTGEPKGALLSNDNFNAMVHEYDVRANFSCKDKMVAIMPIFHGFGLCNCVHMPLSLGASIVLMPKYDSKQLAKIFKKLKPSDIMGVPTLLRDIMNNKVFSNINFNFINYIVAGGAPLNGDEEKFNEFLKTHNCTKKVTKGYGLTEATASFTFSFEECNELKSVGIPLSLSNIKIVKPGTIEEVGYNQQGEICVNGKSVMLGFYNNEDATNNDIKIHSDGLKWLHTGDIGYINNDGKLYLTDRIKRMLIVSGINVYPSLIENVLTSHELVNECCVVKMPHEYKVEVPVAYITLKEGYCFEEKLQNELLNYCKDKLPNKYYFPYKIKFISKMPKTLMNKIDYKKLEDLSYSEYESKNGNSYVLRKDDVNGK